MVMTWSWSKKLTWRNGVTYSLSSSKRDFQVSSLIVSEETRSSRFSISNRLKKNESFSWQSITTYSLSFALLATFSWFDSALSLLKSPISDCIFVCNLSVLSFSAASSDFSCSTSPFCLLLAVSSCLIWAIILKRKLYYWSSKIYKPFLFFKLLVLLVRFFLIILASVFAFVHFGLHGFYWTLRFVLLSHELIV